ncbi:MAG: helix-hairpin-helix domain-containing protein [Deltaproteobacteria bacterium]|nr:helix-hairpin-helix domain-containing protein [Deltaproteobacteria bacterium]
MRLPGALRLLCGVGLDPGLDPASDLELLPALGPVRASAIVRDRRVNGPFREHRELERVPGIGPRTAERLAPWLDLPGPARADGR